MTQFNDFPVVGPFHIPAEKRNYPDLDPSIVSVMRSAIENENDIAAIYKGLSRFDDFLDEKDDPSFDPENEIIGTPFVKYAQRFMFARSKKHTDRIKEDILREEENRQILMNGGVGAGLSMFAAGVVSPLNLIPIAGTVGRVARGSNLLRGAIATSAEAAASASMSEFLLSSTQRTRTPEETAFNIGGAVVLGGMLGGAIGHFAGDISGGVQGRAVKQRRPSWQVPVEQRYSVDFRTSSKGLDPSDQIADLGVIDSSLQQDIGFRPLEEMIRNSEIQFRVLDEPYPMEEPLQIVAGTQGERMVHYVNPEGTLHYVFPTNNADDILAAFKKGHVPVKDFEAKTKRGRTADNVTLSQDAELLSSTAGGKGQIELVFDLSSMPNIEKATVNALAGEFLSAGDVSVNGKLGLTAIKIYTTPTREALERSLKRTKLHRAVTHAEKALTGEVPKDISTSPAFQNKIGLTDIHDAAKRVGLRARKVKTREELVDYLADIKKRSLGQVAKENALKNIGAFKKLARKMADESGVRVEIVNRKGTEDLDMPTKHENIFPSYLEDRLRAGSWQFGEDTNLVDRFGLLQLANKVTSLPVGAIASNTIFKMEMSRSPVVRALASMMGITPFKTEGDIAGIPSSSVMNVEARKVMDGNKYGTNSTVLINEAFTEYSKRAAKEGLPALNIQDFDTALGREFVQLVETGRLSEGVPDEIARVAKTLSEMTLEDGTPMGAGIKKVIKELALDKTHPLGEREFHKILRTLDPDKLSGLQATGQGEVLKQLIRTGVSRAFAVNKALIKKADLEDVVNKIYNATLGSNGFHGALSGHVRVEEFAPRFSKLKESLGAGADVDDVIKGMSDEELESLVTDIGFAGGKGDIRKLYRDVSFWSDHLTTQELEPILSFSAESILRRFARYTMTELRMLQAFKSTTMAKQIKAAAKDFDDMISSGKYSEKEIAKLVQEKDEMIRMIEISRDRLMGKNIQANKHHGILYKAIDTVMSFNFMTQLGGILASSFPDVARHSMVFGVNRTSSTLIRSLATEIASGKTSRSELIRAGVFSEHGVTQRHVFIRDGHYFDDGPSGLQKKLKVAETKFSNATGITWWNASHKNFAAVMSIGRITDAAAEYASAVTKNGNVDMGKVRAEFKTAAARSGLSPDDMLYINEQIQKHAVFKDGVAVLPEFADWDIGKRSQIVIDKMYRAATRDAEVTIVTPGLDKPVWLTDPVLKMFGQYKAFSISSLYRVLLAGLQDYDLNFALGFTQMIGLGVMTASIKRALSGREDAVPDDIRELISEGIDRSGALGIIMEGNHIIEKMTAGRVGMNPLLGIPPNNKQFARSLTDTIGGPSFGTIARMSQVGGAIASGNVSRSTLMATKRLIPGNTLIFVDYILNKSVDRAGDALGLPEQ